MKKQRRKTAARRPIAGDVAALEAAHAGAWQRAEVSRPRKTLADLEREAREICLG